MKFTTYLLIFQDSTGTAPGPHQFKVGMKFEAIDPFNPSHIVVVTVIKVLRFNYFVLGVDSLATYFVCHANSRNIFPCGWAKSQSLPLTPPRGTVILFIQEFIHVLTVESGYTPPERLCP